MTSKPLISIADNTFKLDGRVLWKDLSLDVQPGEFLAILGPNGAGKTTLLRGLLGLYELGGSVKVEGKPPRKGSGGIGYIPQQKTFDRDAPIRGRDLVALGLNGHQLGFGVGSKRQVRLIDEAIREAGASEYADQPIGLLSGGQQQRLRIAQSLLGKPKLLFCDEPLSSLDLKSQQSVSRLIDEYRKKTKAAVLFVTHDINPVLDIVDKVLYLANGKWAVGTPGEVLTSASLSGLYGTPVDVVKVRGRIVVVTAGDSTVTVGHHHAHATAEGGTK